MWGPGARVGEWTLGKELARGGQGAVFEARHAARGARAAIKLLLDRDPESRRRFRQEALTLARLRHEHLPRALDQGELPDGTPFMVMEYVEGVDLRRLVEQQGLPPLEEVVRLLCAVAAALHHCHQQGVIHRDVKPANVLLERETGRPLLVDFGLIKRDRLRLAWSTQDAGTLTSEGEILGTPGYMAPEQLDPGRFGAVGPRSDVYGLGATLYYLLSGAPPFQGATVLDTLRAVAWEAPPDPRRRNPAVPAALAALCLSCLAKDQAERPLSAEVFAAELRAAGLARRPGRRPALLVAVSGALLLGAATLVLSLAGSGGPAAGLEEVGVRAGPSADPPVTSVAPTPSRAPPPGLALEPVPEVRASAERLLASAEERIAKGDPRGAREDVELALQLDPTHARAWTNRGFLRMQAGDHQGARGDLDRAIELDRRSVAAHANRGYLRYLMRDYPGALSDLNRALELDPRDAQSYGNRAAVRRALGDEAGAAADLEWFVTLNPDHSGAVAARAMLEARQRGEERPRDPQAARECVAQADRQFRQGDLAGSLRSLNLAVALDPELALARVNRGFLRGREGDLKGAAQDLDRALELDPSLPEAWFNRALVRRQLGDLEGASRDLDRLLELAPRHARACLDRGILRQRLGDLAGARADMDRAIELQPGWSDPWANRGALRLKQDDQTGGRQDLQQALTLEPRNAFARFNLATLDLRTGDVAAGIAGYQAVIDQDPGSPLADEARAELARLLEQR